MKNVIVAILLLFGMIGCQAQNGEIGGTIALTSTESFDRNIESLREIADDLNKVLGSGVPSGTFTYGGSTGNSDFNLYYTSGETDVSNGFVEIDVDFSTLVVTKFNGYISTDTTKLNSVIELNENHSVNVNLKTGTIDGILATTKGNKLLSVDGIFFIQYKGLLGEFEEVGGTTITGNYKADRVEATQ